MIALESDEEMQRKGVVGILYNVGSTSNGFQDAEVFMKGAKYFMSLPCRFAAMHYCFSDAVVLPFLSLLQLVIGKEGRLRFRTHFGKIGTIQMKYCFHCNNNFSQIMQQSFHQVHMLKSNTCFRPLA